MKVSLGEGRHSSQLRFGPFVLDLESWQQLPGARGTLRFLLRPREPRG